MNKTLRSSCPINYAVEIFGDQWTLLIIRDLMLNGKHNFGEFRESDEKIASNILTDRLKKLEERELVIKQVDPANGRKLIYRLTDKGIDLAPLLIEMTLWSRRQGIPVNAEVAQFADLADKNRALLISNIKSKLSE